MKILSRIRVLTWGVLIFALVFQCVIPSMSAVIIPSLAIYIVLSVNHLSMPKVKGWAECYIVYLVYLLIAVFIGILGQSDVNKIMRFFLILFLIPFSILIKNKTIFSAEWRVFKIVNLIKAIAIIVVWIILFVTKDYTEFRIWARASGAGDIYILQGIPRVQLLGNTFFVIAFVIDIMKQKKITVFSVIMLIGGLVSGNFAYFLGYFAFGGYICIKKMITKSRNYQFKVVVLAIVAIVVGTVFYFYTEDQAKVKSEVSNVVRVEQAKVLTNTNILVGKGLGKEVKAQTSTRRYNGDTYFELQTLYFYYQIGIIGMLMFYLVTLVPFMKLGEKAIVSYLIYLLYSFWNPYCFDSTQIVVIILISNILCKEHSRGGKLNEGICFSNSVLSK